jgi:hypothetical protein
MSAAAGVASYTPTRAAELRTILDAAEAKAGATDRAEAERAARSRWRRLREALRGSDVRR